MPRKNTVPPGDQEVWDAETGELKRESLLAKIGDTNRRYQQAKILYFSSRAETRELKAQLDKIENELLSLTDPENMKLPLWDAARQARDADRAAGNGEGN